MTTSSELFAADVLKVVRDAPTASCDNVCVGNKRVQYLVLALEEFTAEGLDVKLNG